MEPTTLENPPTPADPDPLPVILDDPNNQSFTGKAKDGRSYYEHWKFGDPGPEETAHLTAYAMGIKFKPISIPCDRLIPITDASSNVTLNPVGLPESNVKDGNLNTKWMSKVTQNPSIRLNLQDQKPVCKVDIAWGEGNMRKYKFTIEVSTDNQNWGTPIFTDQSKGTTTDYESYVVPPTPTKFVRVTVTDSGLGSPTGNSQAQISEIRVFSNA